MSATLVEVGKGVFRWYELDFERDIEKQAGLCGVKVDPGTVNQFGLRGWTPEGSSFSIDWVPEVFLEMKVSKEEQAFVDALAKVLEYGPFCRYCKDGLVVYEWDALDPEGRFAELQSERVTDLQRI